MIFMNMRFDKNKIEFVEYSIDFLEKSWLWLNDPEIKYLTCTPDFEKNEQIQWFLNLNKKKDYFIKGIKYDNIPIGACGLKHISTEDAEYWGYIGAKEYWGKGIGSIIMEFIETISKKEYNLSSIYLNVIISNKRALNLYLKNEYYIESFDGQRYKMRKQI